MPHYPLCQPSTYFIGHSRHRLHSSRHLLTNIHYWWISGYPWCVHHIQHLRCPRAKEWQGWGSSSGGGVLNRFVQAVGSSWPSCFCIGIVVCQIAINCRQTVWHNYLISFECSTILVYHPIRILMVSSLKLNPCPDYGEWGSTATRHPLATGTAWCPNIPSRSSRCARPQGWLHWWPWSPLDCFSSPIGTRPERSQAPHCCPCHPCRRRSPCRSSSRSPCRPCESCGSRAVPFQRNVRSRLWEPYWQTAAGRRQEVLPQGYRGHRGQRLEDLWHSPARPLLCSKPWARSHRPGASKVFGNL